MSHRKSGIKSVLSFKSLPDSSAARLSSLRVDEHDAFLSESPHRDPQESAHEVDEGLEGHHACVVGVHQGHDASKLYLTLSQRDGY